MVVGFLIAQALWWMVFQRQLVQQSIDYAEEAWLREAAVFQQLWLSSDPAQRSLLAQELQQSFPHLRLQGEQVVVDPNRLAEFRNQQLRYLRMLAFEGPFFLLVMLLGLAIIGRSLQREQRFKQRNRNFLMAATHEFRTPITTLRLIQQTLQMRELPNEKRQLYLASMAHEIRRLEDLSEKMLAAARLEQGLFTGSLKRLELGSAVQNRLDEIKPTLEARGAKVWLELSDQPLWVEADPEALGLILSNLLENALKYSHADDKPIWVRVMLNNAQALVQVEDRGIGIAKEALGQLFEPFFRAQDESTRSTPGMGLGLYLVRSLMDWMHGSVACEALDRGCRFSLRFPMVGSTATTPKRGLA